MDIRQKLSELNFYNQVQKNAKPKLGFLFDKIFDLEDEILTHFGLPPTIEFIELLHHPQDSIDKKEITSMVNRLKEVAKDYLNTDAYTDIEILERAKEEQQSPFHALPLIGIRTHVYMTFLYKNYLLTGQDRTKDIKQAFHLCKSRKSLNALANLTSKDGATYQELKSLGLPHLDEFIDVNKKNMTKVKPSINFSVNEDSEATIIESFKRLAKNLLLEYELHITGSRYQIVDIEFYYYNPEVHPDGFTMLHYLGKGLLEAHRYGVDITLKNTLQDKSYGGLLIRGLRNVKSGEIIRQSHVKNLIINSANASGDIFYKFVSRDEPIVKKILATTRPTLGEKKEKKNKYRDALYHFVLQDQKVFENYDKKKEEVIRHAVDMETGKRLSTKEKVELRGYQTADDN